MNLQGKRVRVMGLGVQGSGIAAARYAAQQGALVRVADMRALADHHPHPVPRRGLACRQWYR
ncbi:MAG: hypothetical protein JO125_09070 [Chloroflexi bacterium]|nr:hypothetical protein [Chloroflexota bacterium]